jgi:hypothetical protein
MKLSVVPFLVVTFLTACTSQPTIESINANLVQVQNDLNTIAANANPTIQAATEIADAVVPIVYPPAAALMPVANAVSAAIQASNTAIAMKQAKEKALTITAPAAQ